MIFNMAVAPNSTYTYMVPLEQQLWDKDLNVPLADGAVSFYKNSDQVTPKNVYIQTGSHMAGYTFVSVGSSLTLSSIGTFVNPNDGTNFTPFLWPFNGDPNSPPSPLTADPYFIEVESSTSVTQFTIENWPPNIFGAGNSPSATAIFVTPYTSGVSTWIPQSNMVYVMFECMGSGGGGAGAANSAGTEASGGGGAGGYSRKTVSALTAGASQSITVGTAGVAGTAGANAGGNGNPSSVGSLCVANGGGGAPTTVVGGAGATAGTGDIAATGMNGLPGFGTNLNTTQLCGGGGASTQWGKGGLPGTATMAGTAGTGYGAGGSSGISSNGGGTAAGGEGAPGFVLITEYLSS